MAASEIDSPLASWVRQAFAPVSAASLQKATHSQPAAHMPDQVWIVWRGVPYTNLKTIELVTADGVRAERLAASEYNLWAEVVDVEDTSRCPGWCPNREEP